MTLPACSLEGICEDGEPYQDVLAGLLRELAAQGARRWVADLRLNLGGNMWPMIAGLGPLLGDGLLGSFVKGDERWQWWHRSGVAGLEAESLCAVGAPPLATVPDDVPVAVLVSPLTASSGEIITASCLGRQGTRLFGEATRGLTTSNSLYALPDGAAVVVATALDADRTGRLYDSVIVPHQEVATDWTGFQTPQDPGLQKALTWLAFR